MKRADTNLVIDVAAFVAFVLLTATGVVVRYVLPPGSGQFVNLWGLDRHDWGSIHFWVSVAFLLALAIHLLLHWRWIACKIQGRPAQQGSTAKIALGIVGLLALVALAVAPLVSPLDVRPAPGRADHRGHDQGAASSETSEITGRMTLAELEELMGVPAAHVKQSLGLPRDTAENVPIGRLARDHGFGVSRIRELIRDYSENPTSN